MNNPGTISRPHTWQWADNLNLTGITDQVTAANSNVLSYTPANRLASASGAWGNKAYSYDGVGNRITDVTTGGASVSRTQYYSNTSNRLNDIWENGAQLRVYTYDGVGNTLTESRPGEAFAYTYNKRNRLASVTRNGSLWGAYVYNACTTVEHGEPMRRVSCARNGEQLVSRTSPAPAAPLGNVHYIHDLDGHLIAEADGATGATLRDYVWLPANDNEVQDLPLAVIDGVNTATPVTSFIHTDHLGRPTRMTNAAKVTVWQAVWPPWGEAQSMTGSVTNNLRFPGQYFQIETGLNDNHHRQYDPFTGRYTQPDPLGFVDGPSVYAYAGNSPFMYVDPTGLAKCVYSISKHTLNCAPNGPPTSDKVPIQLGPDGVFSGGGMWGAHPCGNNMSCINESRLGPTPPGTYRMVRNPTKYGGSYWLDEGRGQRLLCKLGLARCGFYLHFGRNSEGCITVNMFDTHAMRNWGTLTDLLNREDGNNVMEVRE